MLGGTALARMHCESNHIGCAAFDESNTFTAVRTPRWWWFWSVAPLVRAWRVWPRLGSALRARLGRTGWAYPAYTRLAMGHSHSVHILMTININYLHWKVDRVFAQDLRGPWPRQRLGPPLRLTARPPVRGRR